MTWIGWLNRLLLRWFFVRLAWEAGGENRIFLFRWVRPFPWNELRFVGGRKIVATLRRRSS